MAVRGPIAKKGKVSHAIVSNVDLAATITNLAHTDPRIASDGRSFKRLLRKPRHRGNRAVLLESYLYPSEPLDAHLDLTRPFVTGAQSGAGASASGATASSSAPPPGCIPCWSGWTSPASTASGSSPAPPRTST